MFNSKYIYLDNASSTPIDKKVIDLMSVCNKNFYSNPTSIHSSGVKVREIIEESRSKIAKGINAHNDEIIFTGSSTESNALAIIGLIRNIKLESKIPHIITSQIEHPAVLENCRLLEERGEAEVTYVSVDKNGILNLEELKESLKENTVLVSIMYANNEIGTIQPIQEIAKIIRHFRKGKSENKNDFVFPVFHTDATQAMNYLDTSNVEKLGVDMMSFNGSKIYGPKGIGVLYKKRSVELASVYKGGDQESGLRSGTESVATIAGLALAFDITNKMKTKESKRLTTIRDYAIDKLLKIKVAPYKIVLNGDNKERLPNNINISITGISSELLVIEFDAKGIEVSAKSACKSDDDTGSHVIKAIRKICKKNNEEEGSFRITLGRQTKNADMDTLVKVLTKILSNYSKWK
ncbi:MAG: cysteine desulfurase family protein [Candidatus Nomurabacteria bacterium]